jgi:glycosyltransferase involved in cell wall biosynthesis
VDKVYFIACGFPPVGRGNAITNACVADQLANDFDVEVICRRPSGDMLLSYQEDQSLVEGLDPRLKVHRIKAVGWAGLNELLYAAGVLPCYYLNWAWSAWRRRGDLLGRDGVLFAVHPLFSGVLLGVWLKRETGMPLVVDFRDDFAGSLSRGWRRILAPLYSRLERWVMKQADAVTVTTPTLKDWLIERHGIEADCIEVVYNIVPEVPGEDCGKETDAASCETGREISSEISSETGRETSSEITSETNRKTSSETTDDVIRVGYAGALSAVQRPETVLEAHAILRQRRPELGVEVEIYGPESPYYRYKMRDKFTPGTRFGGFLPRDQVEQRLRRCQVGFVALSSSTYAYALPTKLIDYIQMGMPVLAALPPGAARDLIEQNEIGLVADPGDAEGLSQCLERLAADSQLRRRCGQNAAALQDFFRPAAQVQKWAAIFHRLGAEESGSHSGALAAAE